MPAPLLLRRCRPVGDDERAGGSPLVDVLLRDGLVAAVVPSGASPVVAAGTEVVDVDGRWLMPGLWDEHVHLGQWALARRRLDVSGATSAAHAAALVRERVLDEPAGATGETLVGAGFRDGLWPDAPSPQQLDDAAGAAGGPGRPVVLVSADLHCAWLSSAAAREVAAPLGVVPDASGLVREEAAFAVQRALGRLGDDELDAAVAAALAEAAGRGVVGVVDLEMTDAPGGTAAVWARRGTAGGAAASAGLRVEAGTYPQHLEHAVATGVRTGRVLPGLPAGSTLVGGPLKVITDGSLNTRTACCLDPYAGGGHGELAWPLARLVPLLRRGLRAGLVPAVHAIGDAAVRSALDAFAELTAEAAHGAGGAGGGAGGVVGGRIEHAQLVADDDVPRFAALGVLASVQPAHLLDDRDVAEVHWRGRTGRAFPLRALLDAGARLALGSDAPVAPLDPWRAMAAAVARTAPVGGGRGGGRGGTRPPWHPEQSITPREALAASTRGRVGVAPGSPADVVAVDADPLHAVSGEARSGVHLPRGTASVDGWSGPRVGLVVVGGRVVHDGRDEQRGPC